MVCDFILSPDEVKLRVIFALKAVRRPNSFVIQMASIDALNQNRRFNNPGKNQLGIINIKVLLPISQHMRRNLNILLTSLHGTIGEFCKGMGGAIPIYD